FGEVRHPARGLGQTFWECRRNFAGWSGRVATCQNVSSRAFATALAHRQRSFVRGFLFNFFDVGLALLFLLVHRGDSELFFQRLNARVLPGTPVINLLRGTERNEAGGVVIRRSAFKRTDAPEKGQERVIIRLWDRIELVVVAARTAE